MTATEGRFAPWADAVPAAPIKATAATIANSVRFITSSFKGPTAAPRGFRWAADFSRGAVRRSTTELPQLLEQLTLPLGDVGAGKIDAQGRQDVAPPAPLQLRKAMAPQAEDAARARARRHLDAQGTVEGRYRCFAPEDGGRDAHRDRHREVVALPLEHGVRQGADLQVQVAARPAAAARPLSRGAHARAFPHAGWNPHLD